MPYQLLADAVLVVHAGIVIFVVGGLPATIIGNWCGCSWANNWCFRVLHLAAILLVVAQAWLGQYCTLTTLESWLRVKAGAPGYSKSFIEHWLQQLIFYEAPFWVFVAAYTFFAVLVAWTWWAYPPNKRSAGSGGA